MTWRIGVFGKGIGALSAAHELTQGERGQHYDVTVIGPADGLGGKAVSYTADGLPPAKAGFPAEHGFRFFPAFYRHVIDTMAHIPSRYPIAGRATVKDHLHPTPLRLVARKGEDPIVMPSAARPADLNLLISALIQMFKESLGIPWSEGWFFIGKLLDMARCPWDEKMARYEQVSWWDFIEAERKSVNYRRYLAMGLTHTLVAADPREINAKTGGDVLIRILFDTGFGGASDADRVLDGPTQRVWIDPWRDELSARGVHFQDGELVSIDADGATGHVKAALVKQPNGSVNSLSFDQYVSGLPVEDMTEVLRHSPALKGRGLDGIETLAGDVRSMTGMQFYLKEPLSDIARNCGHQIFLDSPWAVTGIVQTAFWRPPFDDLSQVGDGDVKAVWSVIASNWKRPYGADGIDAEHATLDQWKDCTVAQLQEGLNTKNSPRFDPATVAAWHLDRAVTPRDPSDANGVSVNRMPLLVNHPKRWELRPPAVSTKLPNFALAADYVRTNTDLATMEAANEAARRAVNGVLDRTGVGAPRCAIFKLYLPEALGAGEEQLLNQAVIYNAQRWVDV